MSIDPRYGIVLNDPSYSEEAPEENSVGVWKVIEEFPLYEITARGDIRRVGQSKLRKTYINPTGVRCICLRKGDKTYCRSVGKLARIAWGYYYGE